MVLAALLLVVFVAVAGAGTVGYALGNAHGLSNLSPESNRNQSSTPSIPAASDPFSFTFLTQGNYSTGYVPILFLGSGISSQVYVRYSCSQDCQMQQNSQNFSIGSLNLGLIRPVILTVEKNGIQTNASGVSFTSATVLEKSVTTETILYSLSGTSNDTGYYSFVFPYSCLLHPLLDIGTQAKNLDYTLIQNWLRKTNN